MLWLVLGSCLACAGQTPISVTSPGSLNTVGQLARLAQTAEFAELRAARVRAAQEGRVLAAECVAEQPRMAACYFYRAVLTGLYYQLHVIGYQQGLQAMIADAQQVLALEPGYADGGAYRLLAEIYRLVPETSFRPDAITRDLARAAQYIAQALAVAPAYFENHYLHCAIALAREDLAVAQSACTQAGRLLRTQRRSPHFAEWRRGLQAAKKRLARRGASALTNDEGGANTKESL